MFLIDTRSMAELLTMRYYFATILRDTLNEALDDLCTVELICIILLLG